MWPLSQIKPCTNVAHFTRNILPMKRGTDVALIPQKPYINVDPILKKPCTTVSHITRNIVPLKLCTNVVPIPQNTLPIWPISTKTLHQWGPYPKNSIPMSPLSPKPSTNVAPVPKNLAPMCLIPKTLYTESLYQSFTLPLLFIFSLIIDVI